MQILFYAVLLGLYLIGPGCGNHTKITYHIVTREELTSVCRNADVLGCAKWEDRKYEVRCDIYMMMQDRYKNQVCYDAVLKHEQRHCYEFYYHGDSPYIIEECTG